MDDAKNVILSWLPPKQRSGAAVTKYIIEWLFIPDTEDEGYAGWELLGETSEFEYKMTAQAKGQIHHFQIYSQNCYGTSKEATGLLFKHLASKATGKISNMHSPLIRRVGWRGGEVGTAFGQTPHFTSFSG